MRLNFTFVLMTLVAFTLSSVTYAQTNDPTDIDNARQARRLEQARMAQLRAQQAKRLKGRRTKKTMIAEGFSTGSTLRSVSFETYRLENSNKPELSARVAQSRLQEAFVAPARPVTYYFPDSSSAVVAEVPLPEPVPREPASSPAPSPAQ